MRDGKGEINNKTTKSAEERDKTTLGQRRKEIKLGVCPAYVWLDWCSCLFFFFWK